jgi:uncharacterized membrane-anchored protein
MGSPRLPPDHPLRLELHDEVHARPSESLRAPLRLTSLALASPPSARAREWEHLRALAAKAGVELGAVPRPHVSVELGAFRLRMERHSEFTRYKFIVPGAGADPFEDPALSALPADWVATLPGEVMMAAHAALLPGEAATPDVEALSAKHFGGNVLIGSGLADGAGQAFTDFRLHDGFSRLLVLDRGLTARQAGRMLQRLLELETYRMMALLALPLAQELAPFLAASEGELSEITTLLEGAREADEPVLLDRLTRLEAATERSAARTTYRFAAGAAYHELVKRRIAELREVRLPGLQTFQEFTERRLAPAMNTCQAAADRQESLSGRVARATQLLSTRVDVSREKQNQAVLASMDRRAEAQLRLQETVEGLSAAAITYYIVGLVGYAAKGAKVLGVPLNPEVVVALTIPVVLALVVFGVRHVRKLIS